MTQGNTLHCTPGCNMQYGHTLDCERFTPAYERTDPRAKLRMQLLAAEERVAAEARGEVYAPADISPSQSPRQTVSVNYRQVPDPDRAASAPAPIAALLPAKNRIVYELASELLRSHSDWNAELPTDDQIVKIVRVARKLLAECEAPESTPVTEAEVIS